MKVAAKSRQEQGSSASRRLRRAGFVPGIVYGSDAEPTAISIEHNPLFHALRGEAFHSSILEMEIDGRNEQVLLRDVQWHAYKPQVLHVDFQRVAADERLTAKVPLHFVNEEVSPAVKLASAIIGRVMTEIEISCLPRDLPAFIEVDLAGLEATDTIHANDVKLPQGVALAGQSLDNPVLVTVTLPAAAAAETAEEASETK